MTASGLRLFPPIASALAAAACAAGPNYDPPDLAISPVQQDLPSARLVEATPSLDYWWRRFEAPALDEFVAAALVQNLELKAAEARLRRSRALTGSARAALFPVVTSGGSVERSIDSNAPGGDDTFYANSVNASWEIDLFGGARRAVEAARRDAEAAQADLDAVRLVIVAEVARRYIDAGTAKERLSVGRSNLASQQEILQIAEWRLAAGLIDAIDVEQARQLTAQTAAALPSLDVDFRQAANRIALLTGVSPGDIDARLADLSAAPTFADAGAEGIPIDFIRRRPDVAAAERRLAAETARIGVRKAALYPVLSLSGSYGGVAFSPSDILDAASGEVSALIAQTLFQGGRRRADLRAQQAAADAALADFTRSALEAFEDVDNAFAARTAAQTRLALRRQSEQAARNASDYLRARYAAGLIDFPTVLDAERTLLAASDARVGAEAERSQTEIALVQALGGGAEGGASSRLWMIADAEEN